MARPPVCRHLVGLPWAVGCPAYYEWFTGVGLEKELLCAACVRRREGGEVVELVEIEASALEDLEGGDADLEGVRGAPEVRVRLAPFDDQVDVTQLPWRADELVDFAPVESEPGTWRFVLRTGAICRLDGELCTVELPPDEPDHEPWAGHALTPRLHVSADGAFAAVTNDFGHWGRVYDLATAECTFTFEGGDHYSKTVPLSFAFAVHEGRTVAIHRTAWNRLDVSDAATGELLTGGDRELDYFHGRLLVSPDGLRILDDGWRWHPRGAPTVWALADGLETHVLLTDRVHWWNRGQCWLDVDRVAISGIGTDDDWMIDGARVFHTGGDELTAFAGPSGHFFGDGDRLFASAEDGLTVWDVESGTLVARVDGFVPTHQHRSGRELAELRGATLHTLRY